MYYIFYYFLISVHFNLYVYQKITYYDLCVLYHSPVSANYTPFNWICEESTTLKEMSASSWKEVMKYLYMLRSRL